MPTSVVGLAFYGVGNHRFNNHIAKFKMMTGLRTMKKSACYPKRTFTVGSKLISKVREGCVDELGLN